MKNRNKIFFSLLLIVALCVSSGYSQKTAPAGKLPATVTIANVTATTGNRASVPVNASDLVNLSAISLSIQYDPAVLTWVGADSLAPGIAAAGNFIANAVGGYVKIAWFSLTPVSISNGKLFNLNFTYNGGSSPLNFVLGNQCELSDISGNLIATNYVNGSVTSVAQNLPSIPSLITPLNNSTGNSLNPQLVWGKADRALSYSLLVATDADFNNIIKNQTGITDTTFNLTNLTPGTQYFWKVMAVNLDGNSNYSPVWNFTTIFNYTITTLSSPAAGGTTSGGGTFSAGTSDTVKAVANQGYVFLNWTEGAAIVSTDPVYIFTVNSARTLTANFSSLLQLTSPNGDELWIAGYTYSIAWQSNNIANVKIEYSTNNGTDWQLVSASTPSAAGYYEWMVPNTPSNLCKMKISDASDAAVSDQSDNVFTITNSTTTPALILGTSAGAPGDSVDVALNVKNLANIGAISLTIQFDTTKVSFGRALNFDPIITGATFGSSSGKIMISWYGIPSITLSDNKMLDLRFYFKGSTDKTPITFKLNQSEITDGSGNKLPASYINGAIMPGVNLSGTLVYAKATAYPLANVKVYLKDPVKILDSTFTSETGTFIFNGKAPGTYKFGFVCTKPWGGVNSTDALLIRKYISFSATFDSLQIKAADVNRSTTINSTDALLIRRRVASIDSTFAVGDWVFEEPVFTVGSAPVDLTIRCLSTGDVNASYSPVLAKTNSEKIIVFNNHNLTDNTLIDLPITLNKNVSLGAVTLYIDYNPASLQVNGVISPLPEMTYSISNGRISIAWDDVNPVMIKMNTPFIVLKAKVLNAKEKINLSLPTGCELADPNGKVIQDNLINAEAVNLNLPKQFELFANFPNPFNPSTTIMYSLPEDMTVSLIIYDVLGREVKTLVNETMKAGTYSATWLGNDNHGGKVASGTYFYKLQGNNSVSIKKMVIMK